LIASQLTNWQQKLHAFIWHIEFRF